MTDLVRQMFDEIQPLLPTTAHVYVLFDSWYASADLMNDIRSRHGHFICSVKSNRTLSGSCVSAYWRKLSRQRIKRVTTSSTKGSHTYSTRCTTGRLRGLPQPFVCSDVHLRAQAILRFYAFHWPCETDNFLLKERLGLADFRVHALEAVQRWFSLVFAAYAFVRVRIAQARLTHPSQPAPTFHDVIAQQQRWHLEHLVVFVAHHARMGWSNEQLVAPLMPT